MGEAGAIDMPHGSLGCGPLMQSARDAGKSLRQEVFEFVRGRGRAARADVTDALQISAGSATTLTADLIAAGFLHEVEGRARELGRGRPRISLEVTPDAAFVIGIKLAFKRHTAVLSDFSGNVVANVSLPSGEGRRPVAQILSETEQLIDALLKTSGKSFGDIRAIGLGVPGVIDHKTNRLAWSPLLPTRDADLSAGLQDRLGVPVVLDNDANMLTLAELWFGEGRAMLNFAVVTIESGVGMGLALDNSLYRGAYGMGLELGHTKVALDGALCQCGRRGCLEAYLADFALVREARTAYDHGLRGDEAPEEVLEYLFARAREGDGVAKDIFGRAGRYLALGLSNVVQLFDPSLIILSGGNMRYDYLYAQDVLDEMQRQALVEGRKPCRVSFKKWDDLVWARGASALALSYVTDQLMAGEAWAA